jgi:hypothetical protein
MIQVEITMDQEEKENKFQNVGKVERKLCS